MGLTPTLGRWRGVLVVVLLALLAGVAHAQGGGALGGLADREISLVNPFNGTPLTVTVLRVMYVGGGLVLLLAGWSAYRLALAVAGAVVGASLGASFTANAAPMLSLVITLGLALFFGILARFVYLLAVALVGGYAGLLLTGQVITLADVDVVRSTLLIIYVVGAIVGSGLALALAVELTIILTSGIGAVMLAGGTGLLDYRFGVFWTILLFVVGVVVQMRVARSRGGNPFERG